MVHPALIAVAFFLALCIPVLLASSGATPRARRRRHGRDYGAMAEIEEHDIGQMIQGINERRRRNGRPEIGEELAAELLRDPRRRREQL